MQFKVISERIGDTDLREFLASKKVHQKHPPTSDPVMKRLTLKFALRPEDTIGDDGVIHRAKKGV